MIVQKVIVSNHIVGRAPTHCQSCEETRTPRVQRHPERRRLRAKDSQSAAAVAFGVNGHDPRLGVSPERIVVTRSACQGLSSTLASDQTIGRAGIGKVCEMNDRDVSHQV